MTGPAERLALALADRYRIERELGAGGMNAIPGDLAPSADGHTLFYQQYTTDASDIFARDPDHPAAPGRPVVATPAEELGPAPSSWPARATGCFRPSHSR